MSPMFKEKLEILEAVRGRLEEGKNRNTKEILARLQAPLGSMLKDKILTLQEYKKIEALIKSF